MNPRVIFPMLVTVMLAGCAASSSSSPDAAMAPNETERTPHVERVRVELATAFAPAASALPVGEATRLESFLDQAAVRPGDTAYVAVPPGDPLASARIGRIATLLAERGVGVRRVAPPASGVAPNHVLLMVDRYIATAPACPDWSGPATTRHDNTPSDNFGCATATDFALMLDNPRDLEMGRALGPDDAVPAIDAVERYRTGHVKPLIGGSDSSQGTGASGAAGGSSASTGGASAGAQ